MMVGTMGHQKKPKADSPYPPGWEPFLYAINANLDDDTPRLVFADRLQENGDEARAEFIRIQCELHRVHPGYDGNSGIIRGHFSDAQRNMWRREKELRTAHRDGWARGIPAELLGRGWDYRRGFVCHLSATARQWIDQGEAARRVTPVESVGLARTAGVEQVFHEVSLVGLRRLFLVDLTSAGANSLAASPALDTLDGLGVSGVGESALAIRNSIGSLVESPRLANLSRAWVQFSPIGDAVAFGLAGNSALRRLVELKLLNTGLTAPWLDVFIRSPAASGLRVLNLQANPLGDDGVRRLVNSPLTGLEELNIRYNNLTAGSARLLAAWPGLRSVRTLLLSGNEFGPEGARALLGSEHLAGVTTLELPALRVHKQDRERLADLPEYQRIRNVRFA